MYFVEFSDEAENDSDEVSEYYDRQSPNLGLRFIEDVYKTAISIQNNPSSFHYYGRHKNIRRCNLSAFPYSIYYSVDEHKVILLAIIHQRRSNKYVTRRLK
jgi:plasmid stabilization system protein ParE